MTWPMANSHRPTSKKPITGASTLRPRAMKMMRSVERVTTHTSARKIDRVKVSPLMALLRNGLGPEAEGLYADPAAPARAAAGRGAPATWSRQAGRGGEAVLRVA